MSKEMIDQIILEKQFLTLFLSVSVFLVNWTITLKFGLFILKFHKKTIDLVFPWVIVGTLYSLFGRLIIPDFMYFFTTLLLSFILLKRITGTKAIKAFYAAIISLLTVVLSFLLFGQPLLINDKFRKLMLEQTGLIIGSLIEVMLPFFILLFSRANIASKLRRLKTYCLDLTINLYTYLLLVVYVLCMIILYLLSQSSYNILRELLITEAILVGFTLLIIFRIRWEIKIQQKKSEEDHSAYLLKTILSKQREYRNFFQVIRALAERGKTEEIVDYIDNIQAEMSFVEPIGEKNPIFTSLLVAEQIKAREKGIIITNTTTTDLNDLMQPVQVYDIFKDLLQYIVAYEERINSERHHLNIEVGEDKKYYSFMILRELEVKPETLELRTEGGPLDDAQTLQEIRKRIKQFRWKFYFLYRDDELVGCQLKVSKARRLPFWM
ncbi:MAG: hypothetical protein GX202_02900 [Firmicutes bacterium]|nr:hypothetical protein [Bacillota bacterium]